MLSVDGRSASLLMGLCAAAGTLLGAGCVREAERSFEAVCAQRCEKHAECFDLGTEICPLICGPLKPGMESPPCRRELRDRYACEVDEYECRDFLNTDSWGNVPEGALCSDAHSEYRACQDEAMSESSSSSGG